MTGFALGRAGAGGPGGTSLPAGVWLRSLKSYTFTVNKWLGTWRSSLRARLKELVADGPEFGEATCDAQLTP